MNNRYFYSLIRKHLKPIALFFIGGFVVFFLISFLVTPLYKSTSVVYPVNLTENSEESKTEQLMQYFLSEDVMNIIIKKHNLLDRYNVDTLKEKNWRSLIKYYYSQYVKISPTMYESVEITVKDKDPYYARELNWSILHETNHFIINSKKKLLKDYIHNFNLGLSIMTEKMDSIYSDSLKFSKDKNFIKKNIIKSYTKGMRSYAEQQIRNYGDYFGEINFITVVSSPSLNDKKVYPIRSLWGLLGGFSLSVFYIALILFKEKEKSEN